MDSLPSSPNPIQLSSQSNNSLEGDGLASLKSGMSLLDLRTKSDGAISTISSPDLNSELISDSTIIPPLSISSESNVDSAPSRVPAPPLYPRATAPAAIPTTAAVTRFARPPPGKGLRMGVRGGPMGTGELKIPPSIQAKMAAVSESHQNQFKNEK